MRINPANKPLFARQSPDFLRILGSVLLGRFLGAKAPLGLAHVKRRKKSNAKVSKQQDLLDLIEEL